MARFYSTLDFVITLREHAAHLAEVRMALEGGEQAAPLGLAALGRAARVSGARPALDWLAEHGVEPAPGGEEAPGDLAAAGRLLYEALFGGALGEAAAAWVREGALQTGDNLARLLLRFDPGLRRLAALPWEQMAAPGGESLAGQGSLVVLRPEGPPVAAGQPLSVPVRVLQVELSATVRPTRASGRIDARLALAKVYTPGNLGTMSLEDFFLVERQTASPRALEGGLRPSRAPARYFDIVHVHAGWEPAYTDLDRLLAGLQSLGTRLLVWHLAGQAAQEDDAQVESLTRLSAWRLGDAGGPPVLIFRPFGQAGTGQAFFDAFYAELVHDAPLDLAVRRAESDSRSPGSAVLVCAPGGEELLRLSALEERAYHLQEELRARLQGFLTAWWRLQGRGSAPAGLNAAELFDLDEFTAGLQEVFSPGMYRAILRLLEGNWPAADWDHESTSSIPLVRNLQRLALLREQVQAAEAGLERFSRAELERTLSFAAPGQDPRARYVNTWLLNGDRRRPQERPLLYYQPYRLHVDIGPLSSDSSVVNAAAIPEEALAELFRAGGDWVNVAVYSQDFDLYAELSPNDPPTQNSNAGPGSAMRRLWLPALLPSEVVLFGLTPRRAGLVSARICVYYRSQLLQALLLEARVLGRTGPDLIQIDGLTPAHALRFAQAGIHTLDELAQYSQVHSDMYFLSQAVEVETWLLYQWKDAASKLMNLEDDPLLAIPGLTAQQAECLREAGLNTLDDLAQSEPQQVASVAGVAWEKAHDWVEAARRLPNLGYRTLIEYTVSADFREIDSLPQRPLSIFTNRNHGTHVVGIKVGDWDPEWGQGDDWTGAIPIAEERITTTLKYIRERLDGIGVRSAFGQDLYDFDEQNQGTPEKLQEALKQLAIHGAGLYAELFDDPMKLEMRKRLKQPNQVIHVARLKEGEVLPWALVYDGFVDPFQEPDQVCQDLLTHTDAEGNLDYQACAGQPGCPLKTSAPGRVVCPWNFWGIKHVIEQPPQRMEENAAPRKLVTQVRARGPARMCVNVSTQVDLARLDEHRQRLAQLAGIEQPYLYAGDLRLAGPVPAGTSAKAQALELLKDPRLHLIYFYCHGGTRLSANGQPLPYLALGDGADPDLLSPNDFSLIDDQTDEFVYDWRAHPLVFINGCRTVGMEPVTMGGFVQRFAEHGASGVIGTEVRVWEPLAAAFAEDFIAELLQHKQTGEILRRLRHTYLRKYNPLGLVYTLYCSADLQIQQK